VSGLVNGKCYPGNGTESFKYSWPNLIIYTTSASCSGSSAEYNLGYLGCMYVGTDDDTDDYTAYGAYQEYVHVGGGGGGSGDSTSLSTGAIIGIAVGSAAFAAMVISASWVLCRREPLPTNDKDSGMP
jgi:hypothetical protein